MPTECGNTFSIPLLDAPSSTPPTFAPTALQIRTPHPSWIDTIPCSRMRDNMILHYGSFDEDDLCSDLIGGLFEGFNHVEQTGMLVWSDPWHVSGWELTEGFARKWGFLLKGCEELFLATNKWRAMRNEDALIVEV